MVKEYLSIARGTTEEEEDNMKQLTSKQNEIGELEQLAGQLSLSETQEQVSHLFTSFC